MVFAGEGFGVCIGFLFGVLVFFMCMCNFGRVEFFYVVRVL